jgi:hypothetical protein
MGSEASSFGPLISATVGGVMNTAAGYISANQQNIAEQQAADKLSKADQQNETSNNNTLYSIQQQYQPYMAAGQQALSQLSSVAGNQNFTFNQNDPSYQYRLKGGQDAVSASAAAKGGYFSGATGSALQNQGQQAASQEYGNEYNRWLGTTQLNDQNLSNLVSLGYGATNNLSNFQYGTNNNNDSLNYNDAQAQAGAQMGVSQNNAAALQNMMTQNTNALNVAGQVGNSGGKNGSGQMAQMGQSASGGGQMSSLASSGGYGADQVSQNSSMIDNMQLGDMSSMGSSFF